MKKKIMNNGYLLYENGSWYCMLPGQVYKEIPSFYLNYIDLIDWSDIYFQVFDALIQGTITDLEIEDFELDQIFNLIGII